MNATDNMQKSCTYMDKYTSYNIKIHACMNSHIIQARSINEFIYFLYSDTIGLISIPYNHLYKQRMVPFSICFVYLSSRRWFCMKFS